MVTADPEERPNSLLLYISLYTIHLGPTPSNRKEGHIPSSLPRNSRSRSWEEVYTLPLYRSVYHSGGRFSLANKNTCTEVNGAGFEVSAQHMSPTSPFSATLSCCCCSYQRFCLTTFGFTRNMRKLINYIFVCSRKVPFQYCNFDHFVGIRFLE